MGQELRGKGGRRCIVEEVGEVGAGSRIPKVVRSGEIGEEKLCNVEQYFTIKKAQRDGS